MWQPSGKQWGLIWPVALLAVLAWPPDSGKSLGMKLVNYVVDPRGALPPPRGALLCVWLRPRLPGLRSANDYFTAGIASIALQSGLPLITDPVILDAQKQPGWSGSPIWRRRTMR